MNFAKIFEELSSFLSYDFVWFAIIVGMLIALCSSLFGVVLVLKRFSFIGDGLSHVAFGALAIATLLSFIESTAVVLVITVLCAVLLLKGGSRARIKGDAAIAMLSVGSLAIGYIIMSRFPASANVSSDVCSTLFGGSSILTLRPFDVVLCTLVSIAVIIVFVLLYNRIFSVTFDETFAKACGVKTSSYNLVIAVVTAVIVVFAMKLVGSLLISALLVFPALCAMRVCRSFKSVLVCASVLSSFCALLGILASIVLETPVGPTIVAADIVAFLVCFLVGKLKGRA